MKIERSTLYLNRATIESLDMPMARIISVVESSLIEKAHGQAQMPPKTWIQESPRRWFASMASVVPSTGYAAIKWQSGSTQNLERGLPYITGILLLTSVEDGIVVAVMDSTWITQQRTAAASAVAAKHFARGNAKSFAILGCGVQARSHLEALRHVMPQLEMVYAYDIRPEAANVYSRCVEAVGLSCRVVPTPYDAVAAGDVVITGGPIEPDTARVIEPDWLRPGALAITLDYDCYWKPEALAAVDLLVTDDRDQIRHIREQGYFVGCPDPTHELGEVAAGIRQGRRDDRQRIVSLNMGVSVEDVATASEVFALAITSGAGTALAL